MSEEATISSECQCGCGPDCEECPTLEIVDQGGSRYLCDCTETPVCFCPRLAETAKEEAAEGPSAAGSRTRRPSVKVHEHEWVLEQVALFTSPARAAPIPGASVMWGCSRCNCDAARVSEYRFRRPSKKQNPNVFSQDFPEGTISLGNRRVGRIG